MYKTVDGCRTPTISITISMVYKETFIIDCLCLLDTNLWYLYVYLEIPNVMIPAPLYDVSCFVGFEIYVTVSPLNHSQSPCTFPCHYLESSVLECLEKFQLVRLVLQAHLHSLCGHHTGLRL